MICTRQSWITNESARNKKYFYYSTSKELGQRFHKRLTEKAKYYIPIFYGMQPCSFALSCQRIFPISRQTGRKDRNCRVVLRTHFSKAILQNEQDVRISLPGQCYSIKDSTRHKKQLETSEILRIYVPKGGEFELVLADGTRVWMNSETELKFPRAFTGDKRQVELVSGEAYFDVRKDKTKPFIVRNKDLNLTVLGTQFKSRIIPMSMKS